MKIHLRWTLIAIAGGDRLFLRDDGARGRGTGDLRSERITGF